MPNLKKLNLFLIKPKLKATNCLRTLLYNIIIWQIEYVISRGILVLKMDCGCRQKHECVCVCVCARARARARLRAHECALRRTQLYDSMDYNAPRFSVEFSRQEYWSGLPFPPPGDLPDPGMELRLMRCRQILHH